MPVDFQIKNKQVAPIGALAMLMHASEMANGNHWQKKIADAALGTLGGQDYCGVIHWEGTDQWLWTTSGNGIAKIGDEDNRGKMKGRIDRMTPGDMPAFDSTLTKILNDFNTPAAGSGGEARHFDQRWRSQRANAKHSAGFRHGENQNHHRRHRHAWPTRGDAAAKRSPTTTGGKYYQPTVAQCAAADLSERSPRGFAAADFRTTRPASRRRKLFRTKCSKAFRQNLPPITGYVLTNKKENPLVEIALVSPGGTDGLGQENRTILAGWTYGLGKPWL